jgi:hypothetical protein
VRVRVREEVRAPRACHLHRIRVVFVGLTPNTFEYHFVVWRPSLFLPRLLAFASDL